MAFALRAHWFCGVLLTGLGLWLVWQGILVVPGVEQVALEPLHAFAVVHASARRSIVYAHTIGLDGAGFAGA